MRTNMKRAIIINLSFLCFAGIIIFALVFASAPAVVPIVPATSVALPVTSIPAPAPSSILAPKSTTKPAAKSTPTPTPSPTSFTVAQVAQHNNGSDCWSIVRGNVYNLTSWISQHPGGSNAILGMCGIDATTAFVDQHGGRSRPESELAAFKIGTLR